MLKKRAPFTHFMVYQLKGNIDNTLAQDWLSRVHLPRIICHTDLAMFVQFFHLVGDNFKTLVANGRQP
jgi:hypothetical protein